MEKALAAIRLHGPGGTAELEALVDTGPTFTKMSRSLASKVGLKPRRTVSTQVATGEFAFKSAGTLEGELEGVRDAITVVIGEDHEPAVIGYTTLEMLGFKANPVTERLESTHAIEY
ncbi:MAG: aspartyl protease family protein [Candidatus Brockarchaeota archaeon]|nr:aspartyl protease family protein [Candidatus Brockarchaeota archaeon]